VSRDAALPVKGHVFVVRGDLARIHCDARMVPAKFGDFVPDKIDWYLDSTERDRACVERPPDGWKSMSTYPIDLPNTPTLWITKVGLGSPDDFEDAMESTRDFLEQAAKHAEVRRCTSRLLPLLAMHIPASGPKNAKDRLGDLVRKVLSLAEGSVQRHQVDVVLVVKDAAQYDALQAERQERPSAWRALRVEDRALARELASEKKRLSIFLGAGVSSAVGLPTWRTLLMGIATSLGMAAEVERLLSPGSEGDTKQETPPELEAGQALAARCGTPELRQRIVAACAHPRVGLAHLLLANLPASEYVTLNYDTLLEQAARSYGRPLDVLPRRLVEGGSVQEAWLMKLHGSTDRPEEIVITKDEYEHFREHRLAFNGLVQGLLLTRHMLFVGFGLHDPNVQSLVADLEKAIKDAGVPKNQQLGTVLMVGESPATPRALGHDWGAYFVVHDLFADGDAGPLASARRSELLLDALAAHSADRFKHFLDLDFDALLSDEERAVRDRVDEFAQSLRTMDPGAARDRILAELEKLGLPGSVGGGSVKATKQRAYGGVLVREGKVLLREPKGHFDRTVWTFPKGKSAVGEAAEDVAKREVREETGWDTRVLAPIPGSFPGATSITEYFLMEPVGVQGAWDTSKTQAVRWVLPEEAPALIGLNKPSTRDRDLAVLAAAMSVWKGPGKAVPTEVQPGGALSQDVLARALAVAEESARVAGQILRGEMHLPTGPKGGGSHAEADSVVEKVLRARLTGAFPAWKWYGEEGGGNHPGPGETGWIVDPNDGTSAYLRGYRGPAVSIGLVHHGVPVLGVVYAYAAPDDDGDLISGGEGLQLRRNGVVVVPRALPKELGRGDILLFNHKADEAPRAHATSAGAARFRAVPSIAYRLALVAVGDADATVSLNSPTLHDVAGGDALLRCAGGVVVNGSGSVLRYDHEWYTDVFGGSIEVARAHAKRYWPGENHEPAVELSGLRGRARPKTGQAIASSGMLRRAQGCLLGQIAGDSLGSLVEFQSAASIAQAHPGGVRLLRDGGHWKTLAGQPTDDSELALILARRLAHDGRFDREKLKAGYRAWLDSAPFDCGSTTSAGLRGVPDHQSQSNGSLMRVSPLGVFGWCTPEPDLVSWARADSELTHPNPVCKDACAVFVATVAYAIRTGDGARSVYQFARELAHRIAAEPSVVAAVEAAESARPKSYEEKIGWVLTALQNAMWQLVHATSLEDGVVDTVAHGGDTDTTAAIAGALLGAVHGRQAIPQQWSRAVLSCRPLKGAEHVVHPRPEVFWPVDVLVLAERLLVAGSGRGAGSGANH